MASHKRSALKKQRLAFESELGGMDDVFAHEERHHETLEEERAVARRRKACESKNRYATRGEAEAAIAACANYGRTGLHYYRCSYCKGWHLTSHPREVDYGHVEGVACQKGGTPVAHARQNISRGRGPFGMLHRGATLLTRP